MKTLTEVAKCAKEIRKILKEEYPEIKFSVRSENYSMGCSVNVSYKATEGMPNPKEIQKKLSKFEYGHFDGMTDYYDIDNSRDDIPQTKYLFVNLDELNPFLQNYKEDFLKYYGLKEFDDKEIMAKLNVWKEQALYRYVWKKVLGWDF